MLTASVIVSLLGLVISQGPPSSSASHGLELYKEINYPWDRLEGPRSIKGGEACPVTQYTWDFYFKYLIENGVRSFLLGGYAMVQSMILPRYYPPWDKAGLKALKEQVEAKGGKILADLGMYKDRTFDKRAFLESVTKFIKDYPVDGFRLGLSPAYSDRGQSLREVLEAIKEQNLHCSLWFSGTAWQIVKDHRLGTIADTYFFLLLPVKDEDKPVFNTDNFAEEAIKEITLAGVRPNQLALTIPVAAAISSLDTKIGYSRAIFDFKGDPTGEGSFMLTPSTTLYFFSQTRAIDKIELARKHGLHGIALQASDNERADLHPWDPRSLLYALAMNIIGSPQTF
ncbi:hypothetical protein FOZ61_008976 [Perkinsus olseni]|uniref:Chitinase n=1 Tax=Perkinsus olseni TaxID=32597 RepID=A0A7J6M660_PEROL|nr:hypothetical protein FOZ61_008976 [Perkinsus olseni]